MFKMLYAKLACMNIKKNAKFYLPYHLTSIGSLAMLYIMHQICENSGMDYMPGKNQLSTVMDFGSAIIAISIVIILFYINSFLMKRRKKELGLYHILGMEKRHLLRITSIETLISAAISFGGGLLCGILFSKLMTMILFKLMKFPIPMGFEVPPAAVFKTLKCAVIAYVLIFAYNMIQVLKSKPVELLSSKSVGEKEPKAKWLLAIIGAACLGIGYYIAITTESPIAAIPLFFLAVLFVIAGTYLLFITGSIVILKIMRKNKKLYYKKTNFNVISGMIYRMKQNAAGLATICILSTMVLVVVSTTVCMYIGTEDALVNRYPQDISTGRRYAEGEEINKEAIREGIEQTTNETGRTILSKQEMTSLSFTVCYSENNHYLLDSENEYDSMKYEVFKFLTADEYYNVTGKKVSLNKNEVAIYSNGKESPVDFMVGDMAFHSKEILSESPGVIDYISTINIYHYVVVSDEDVLKELYEKQAEGFGEYASRMSYEYGFNMDGTDEEKLEFYNILYHKIIDSVNYIDCRMQVKTSFYSTYGSLLFLGVFVGTLFIMVTALIIYYKQISEGYDDKERFEILQKVGMCEDEVKKTIKTQVLLVFFLPIVVAGIHITAAFKMICRLLQLLNLNNNTLFGYCTIGTIIGFALLYAVMFLATSKAYYRIVKR